MPPNKLLPCFEAALGGANPRSFWIICLIDMVRRIYTKIDEQSVQSSLGSFLWLEPWILLDRGTNSSLATTRPSKLKD